MSIYIVRLKSAPNANGLNRISIGSEGKFFSVVFFSISPI